jgi:hypothetical protein
MVGDFKDKADQLMKYFCSNTSLSSAKIAYVIVRGNGKEFLGLKKMKLMDNPDGDMETAVVTAARLVNLKNGFSENQAINLAGLIRGWIKDGQNEVVLIKNIKSYVVKSECDLDDDLGEYSLDTADLRALQLQATSFIK